MIVKFKIVVVVGFVFFFSPHGVVSGRAVRAHFSKLKVEEGIVPANWQRRLPVKSLATF